MEKLTLEEIEILESIKNSMKKLNKNELKEVLNFSEDLKKRNDISKDKDY